MSHWSDEYLDIPHATLDCAELVERALREKFGRDIRFPRRQQDNYFHRAALITHHARDFAHKVDAPYDGCGVLLLARGRMAHIGLYCEIAGQAYLLHSDAAFGSSTRIPMTRVCPPLYRVEGFYGWLD